MGNHQAKTRAIRLGTQALAARFGPRWNNTATRQKVRDQERALRDRENARWERDRQIWAEKLREVEADRQKAEAEKAELREKVRLLEQSLKEQAAQNHAE
jgi:hypothetical protein